VVGETLSTSGLSGITLYEPGALTLVAQAGTPLAEIEAALDAENQRLAFEPMDHRTLLGTSGVPTIGGVVSGNVSGARRIAVGACRDHMLGVRFVDGMGAVVKNGGRVMKNVTGYDLVKLLSGAYGTLGVLSEVSMKVLPKPEISATLLLHDLSLADSVTAMSAALGSPFEVTGAAQSEGKTCLRIEGFTNSVAYRTQRLKDLLGAHGEITVLDHAATGALWKTITDLAEFASHDAVTRVSIRPSAAPDFAKTLQQTRRADLALDWGGGLMWFGKGANDAEIHGTIQQMCTAQGGHATLIKGPTKTRQTIPVFQPENATVAMLSNGLRARFDPRGILNPGLMG